MKPPAWASRRNALTVLLAMPSNGLELNAELGVRNSFVMMFGFFVGEFVCDGVAGSFGGMSVCE